MYLWEKNKGGLEGSEKRHNSFSDYVREKISIATAFQNYWLIDTAIGAEKPPRGEQFWVPKPTLLTTGITRDDLMECLGFVPPQQLEKAAALTGLDRDSYLEELSGWKCRKVREDDTKVRFFPPEGWQS